MDQGWPSVSFKPDTSAASTSSPSSVASDDPWDKHCKKMKLENGSGPWEQLSKGTRQWPQVERPQVDKGWGKSTLGETPQVTAGWGERPKVVRQPVDKGWGSSWGQWPQVDKRWRQWPEKGWGGEPQKRLSSPLNGSDAQVQDAVLTLQEMKNSSPTNHGATRQVDKGWGQRQHVDKGLEQQPQNGRDDPVELIDDELTLREMKKRSPKNPETSSDLQVPQMIKATEKTNTVTEKVLRIKLMIDSKANRVLFAEAEKAFIDFLFDLLTLPLVSVIQLITNTNMPGSMGNIYESLRNISASYFLPNFDKNSILKPKVVLSAGKISVLPPSLKPTGAKYYRCTTSTHHSYITNSPGIKCPACNHQMNTEMSYIVGGTSDASSRDVGYVKGGLVKYLVMDELLVMPMSTIPSITLLKKFNVVDVTSLEDKIVDFGRKEGLDMLKAALQSKNILSEVFRGNKTKPEISSLSDSVITKVKLESNDIQPQPTSMEAESTNTTRENRLSIKLLIDNKAKRVIFAEAEKEFIDFLFSILDFPISTIIELITKTKMPGSMGNLHKSLETLNPTFLHSNLDKNSILKPREISSDKKLPLVPQTVSPRKEKYFMCSTSFHHSYVTNVRGTKCPSCPSGNFTMCTEMSYVVEKSLEDCEKNVGYVKGGLVTYLVTDELEVMPMSAISSITVLKKFNIVDISVLEEKICDFGVEEGLEVLISGLQSKRVLTEVFLGKNPKSGSR